GSPEAVAGRSLAVVGGTSRHADRTENGPPPGRPLPARPGTRRRRHLGEHSIPFPGRCLFASHRESPAGLKRGGEHALDTDQERFAPLDSGEKGTVDAARDAGRLDRHFGIRPGRGDESGTETPDRPGGGDSGREREKGVGTIQEGPGPFAPLPGGALMGGG